VEIPPALGGPRRALACGPACDPAPDHRNGLPVRSDIDPSVTDRLWQHLEVVHAQVYFAPEHREACEALGLRGGWMAYFASRSAPLGRVSAGTVAATFHGFHPRMVARALPDAWAAATPEAVLAAREGAVAAALDRLLGPTPGSDAVRRATAALRPMAEAGEAAGHPLYAANADLPRPDHPLADLWLATTLLREHRGDGHVAVLTAEGIGGCAAHVLQVAGGAVPRERIQPSRGWDDAEWEAAEADLRDRGWLGADGRLTDAGRALRAAVAERTTAAASAPLRRVGADAAEAALTALAPVTARLLDTGGFPYPNPIGVPQPAATAGGAPPPST
jgi:hypothetical protein